jgi:acyl dehydratase
MLETVMRDLNIGDEVVRLTKPPISKEQLVRYAGASGDFNPLHTDDETARKAGFDGVVAHGMLIMGFLTQAATTWMPKRFLKKINVRFKAVTRAGDTITVTMKVTEKQIEENVGRIVCSIEAVDQNKQVKANGTVEMRVPL